MGSVRFGAIAAALGFVRILFGFRAETHFTWYTADFRYKRAAVRALTYGLVAVPCNEFCKGVRSDR